MLNLSDTYRDFSQDYSNLFIKDNLDLFFQKVLVERNSQLSGYYDLPFKDNQEIFDYLEYNTKFLESITNIIIVGIGGSSLGTKAIDTLLSHQNNRKKIKLRFLEHTDPIMIQKDLRRVKYEDTLFIVISKSGLTVETTSLFKYILTRFSLLKSDRKNHLLAITDSNSPLQKWCQKERIQNITISPNIGGRFSVLSAVGLLPLAILGYDIKKILQGAKQINDDFFINRKDNILKKALFLAKNETTYPINVLFSYSSVFRHFNAWYVQLWGESLGKLDTHQQKRGLTPIALIGSIDQHSFLQLIMQGPANKTITFLSVENLSQKPLYIPDISLEGLEETDFVNQTSFNQLLKLQCISTKESVISQNVPVDSIVLDSLNEQSVGALVFYYELLTSCVGILLQIDTYNQPGVEFGKKILREKFTHS
ncbi:glucose-6-phosphate isomerase [Helicobacter winghamensis]|uniref:glucose-6-phosphate isomerase n=1 Tax=Helicobacter winghamensis TaxID=157268 RepID=UPI0001A290D9|nr:glucose-6-phosphate isomerase [Helicobacter winghamensis]EEO26316.1 glucose-6-phosphate isomerase [Helicobacter winghamensis ATCC BAA-430]PKT77503.1 glucose-6-phosphate isomerase [Helicobacter winghamensis]PKT77764.1 glucose-6-phosphate isomerase [Helicobacter winghamensis]